jgi:hypothetical protein
MSDLPGPGSAVEQVLPGNPDDLDHLASVLDNYFDGAIDAGRHLRGLDSGGWVGEAADAFWSTVEDVLKRLDGAAVAFEEASLALRSYSATLREAQADVRRALSLIDEAGTETRAWGTTNADAVISNLTSPYTGSPVPIASDDPGGSLRSQAGTLIAEAKGRVAAAAKYAADRLHIAADHAPNKPGFWQRRWHNITEFGGGAVEATAGMATFAFKLTPAYELINPDGYIENLTGVVKGLAHGVTHPVEFAKAVVDWDTWAQSPGRALGHLLPTVALAIATAGGGAAARGAGMAEGVEGLAGEHLELGMAAAARSEAERLITTAARAEPAVTETLTDIAGTEGAKLVGLEHRLKTVDSLADKLTRQASTQAGGTTDQMLATEARSIRDTLRYTIQSDDVRYRGTFEATRSELEGRGFRLQKVSNTWAEPGSPEAGPYRGINTQWTTPDGHPFELQFHTAESFKVKMETHAMYEEFRNPSTSAARRLELNRAMTEMSDRIPVPNGAIW